MEEDNAEYRFGDYEVLRPVGAGGMAALFLCRKTGVGGFDRRVVVKVLLEEFTDDPEFVDMFMDEARLAAQLDHPNLVQAVDVGMAGHLPYLAMDYVRGPNLSRLSKAAWRRGEIDYGTIALVFSLACRGLHHAHELTDRDGKPLKVIHRDISPNNIVVSELGVVKLIDFGVAAGENRYTKTEAGKVKGKLQYMAPEQLVADGYDHRVDLFAAGVSLYVVSTNKRPFDKEGKSAWKARMTGDFDRPTEVVEGYPEELERIVLKAMATDPSERYQTARELADDLASFANAAGASTEGIRDWVAAAFPEGADAWHHRARMNQAASDLLSAASVARQSSMAPGEASAVTESAITAMNKGLSVVLIGGIAVVALALIGIGGSLYYVGIQPQDDARADEAVAAYLDEAERLEREGRFQAAIELLERARSGGATDPALNIRVERLADEVQRAMRLTAAQRALASGDLETATRRANEILDRAPTDVDAIAVLTEIRAQRDAAAEASEAEEDAEEPAALADAADVAPAARPRPRPADPKPGALTVRATPEGALVFVDDLPLGEAPQLDASLPPGEHDIRIRAEGYEAHEQVVEIRPGEPLELEIALTAVEDDAEDALADAAALAAEVAEQEPEPEPEPAPPPEPTLQLDAPSLPETLHARSIDEVAVTCHQVEKALLQGGIPEKLAKGSTSALLSALESEFTPGRPITLHPRGMYRFVAELADGGAKPAAIRSGLFKAHAQGRL